LNGSHEFSFSGRTLFHGVTALQKQQQGGVTERAGPTWNASFSFKGSKIFAVN
jgi:hypothetical protein